MNGRGPQILAADWGELTPSDWVSLIFYGCLAFYVASMIPRLFRGNFQAALGAMAFWVTAFAAVLAGYSYRFELGTVGQRVLAVLLPGNAVETGAKEVTIFRRPDGQFVVNASVGAIRIPFVLDTGASTVVLRAEDAARLKIPVRRLTFDIEVSTANGRGLAAESELPQMSIGSLSETNVRILVARPGALHENLLGMSFLNQLASFTIAEDKLVLRGR